jgi:hypothetical protein
MISMMKKEDEDEETIDKRIQEEERSSTPKAKPDILHVSDLDPTDPFDRHLAQWLYGIHQYEEEIREGARRIQELRRTLETFGYRVVIDEWNRSMQVESDSPDTYTISLRFAHCIDIEQVVQAARRWFTERSAYHQLRWIWEAEHKAEVDVCPECYQRYLKMRRLHKIYPDWPPVLQPPCDYCRAAAKYHVIRDDWIFRTSKQEEKREPEAGIEPT